MTYPPNWSFQPTWRDKAASVGWILVLGPGAKGKNRMAEAKKNGEYRIEVEIVVDAYGSEEQAMGM